jgi:hypothetical protein
MGDRLTVEEWHTKFHTSVILADDVKCILWDWQNDRTELLKLLKECLEEITTVNNEHWWLDFDDLIDKIEKELT